MKIGELEQGLDRYGSDFKRWPPKLRADAEALIASDRTAAAIVSVAARLDAALASAMQPMPLDAAFMGRIAASLGHGVTHDMAVRPTSRLLAWAGAAMVAFLITGYAVGMLLPVSQDEDAIAGLIFGDGIVATDSGSVL